MTQLQREATTLLSMEMPVQAQSLIPAESISEQATSIIVYKYGDEIGYIERLNDGRFMCTVGNDGIVDANQSIVTDFMFTTWFDI